MAFRTFSEPILVEPARAGAQIRYFTAEEDIKQGQLVRDGGTNSDEVEPSDTDGEVVKGIALYDASPGDSVAVAQGGTVVRATSGTGSITGDDPIASHGATGQEGEVATAASGDFVIGRAKKDDVGTNDDAEVILNFEGEAIGGSPE